MEVLRLTNVGLNKIKGFPRPVKKFLRQIRRRGVLAVSQDIQEDLVAELIKTGILEQLQIQDAQIPVEAHKGKQSNPITFVSVLNFELTYACLLACNHCSQNEIRKQYPSAGLSTEEIKRVIDEAHFANLLGRGINFTGGEPLFFRDDIFELLSYAKDKGIYNRLNTNGWWGKHSEFVAGGKKFNSCDDLARELKEAGLTVLAVSLDGLKESHDQRRGSPGLFESVMRVIKSCVKYNLFVRILATGVRDEEKNEFEKLVTEASLGVDDTINVKGLSKEVFWGLGYKDMIEIGAAASDLPLDPPQIIYDENLLQDPRLICQGKGFCHPEIIHISPFGGVRSCVQGVGLSNMGNINEESLVEILNHFPQDPVSATFNQQTIEGKNEMTKAAERLLRRQAFRKFSHPCAALVVLANLIQAESDFMAENAREPEESEILRFNLAVARSLGLHRQV